jgi:hypothetical protein
MIELKYLADILTFSRIFIAAILAWLGWSYGYEGLRQASLLMMVSWASDVLDGSLARRSRVSIDTWIGNHDLYFDMSVAIGLIIYMTAGGFINTSVSIIYILFWILLFWRFGILSVLGKLFQAPIYAWFFFITCQHEPVLGWLMAIFLVIVIVITWPRFPQDTIPSFISGFINEHYSSDGSQNGQNGTIHPENGEQHTH